MASFFVKQVILTIIVREHIGAIAYRFPSHRSGWLPQTLHVPSKNGRTVVNFIRGGSHSDEENNAADDENDEANEEANEVSFQDQEPDEHIYREYHDLEDVEIIPFDSEDEECQNIDYVLVGSDTDETTPNNVQIIPFDSDYDDYHESVPFDNDAVEEVDPISDNKKCSTSFDGVVHDQDEISTITEFETDNCYTVSGLDGKEDDSKTTTSISSDGTNESFRKFSSLRDRILSLLSLWRDMDNDTIEDGEHESRSIRKLLHSRAIEYVDELTAFQTECKFCIAQNRSIPTLEKIVPHPKTFLHYVTPKIQAVKLTPEITLRIRNARPSDVGDAIRAIGILGCLVDLYIIALEELIPLVEDRIYDESESVKKEIRNDRRFGQLLECASCGIDIRRRLEDLTNYQRDGAFLLESKRDDDSDRYLEEKESSELEDDEEQRPECIGVSECSRWILGLLALRVDGGMAIRSQNTTGVVLSLAMRSMDLLQVNFRHRGFDKMGKNSLLRDIVDMIRVLAYARDDLNIAVDFIVEACVGFLWKDLTSLEVKDDDLCSEYERDELVHKLTLSETHDTNELSRNATSPHKNSTATENPKDDILSDNTTRAPECLIDYLSPQQRIVVLKSCTRLVGKSQLITNTINSLVDHAIHDLDSDMRKLEFKGKYNTHEIESVDAAILLASLADTHANKHLLNTVGSRVAGSQIISTPSMDFLDGVQVEESSIDDTLYNHHLRTCGDMNLITIPQVFVFENIAIAAEMHYRYVIWVDTDSRSPINLISQDMKLMMYLDDVRTALSKGSKAGAMRKITPEAHPGGTYISAMQIPKNRLKTSLCDCSVIIQAAVAINHKSTTLVMESCLRIAEASTSETMRKMESGDVINLISAIASIGSNTPMTMQSANTLTVLIRMALCREYRTFTVIQLSRLLEAIATTISTQRFPIIYDLVNDESILALIEHGMEKMKCSEIATIQDLANLAWAYAECNKLCSRSSWEHFENLGRCVAAVSSGFTNEGTRTDAEYKESITPAIDHNILCKIAFAVSLMDLDAHDLNQAILGYSRIDKSLFGPTNLLNQIRLLYSIAKSKQNMEHAIPPKYNRDVKRCITAVMKAKMDNLSPYNFALVVWSIGRLCGGEEISSLMTNLPSYTREELGVLSPAMVLRLVSDKVQYSMIVLVYGFSVPLWLTCFFLQMNGIVMVFDAEDIQTNTRVQMMLKNLLLHLDNQIDVMTPKELCGAGRILVDLRSSCLPDGDENIVKVPELNGEILEDDDHNIENEAEELVISSLFPSSYRRDVMQICDVIVTHILNRARTNITHFTPAEMTILLDTFDAKHRKPIFDTIKVEIDRRLGLVRNELSKTDNADIEEGAKVEDRIHSKSYRSKLRNLFQVGGRNGDETTYDGTESEEVSQVINLLRDTLNEDALNMVLLRTAFDSAYDLGRCRWQTTRGLQNRKCAPDCSLSDLYP